MKDIMKFFQSMFRRRRLLVLLAVFGPATITAISDNDAAGVATYSLSGANFGYTILIILIPITILLAITQEMGARIAVVTGKGLGDLIREKFGIRMSIFIFSLLLIANVGTIVADFSAVKIFSTMFNVPLVPTVLIVLISIILFVTRGNYSTNQKVFLFGVILYFAYVFSAIKSQPDWPQAISHLIIPSNFKFSKEFIITAIAVLGTTITPWGQFFIQSFVIDKKLSIDKLKYVQTETYFGAILTDFFTFFMIVATAATLFTHHISLQSGEQAALAIKPFAGDLASVLFGIGLMNAALMGIVIIALTTAYAFSEFFGFEGSLDAPFVKGKMFYGIFFFQVILAALVIILPNISLFTVVLYTQSLNAILLPVVLFFLLKFTNNKGIMGQYVNKTWYNYFAIFSIICIIAAATIAVLSSFGLI